MEQLFCTADYVTKQQFIVSKIQKCVCELLELNGLDMGDNYFGRVACSRFVSSVASYLRDSLRSNVQN